MTAPQTKPCLAITVPQFSMAGESAFERLTQDGFRVKRNPFSRVLRAHETVAMARDAVGVVAGVESWDAHVLAGCSHLRVISRLGVGVDRIDVAEAQRRGIAVLTTPEPVAEPVAELTLTMILSLLRHLSAYRETMARGCWQPIPGRLLAGKTLGIVGLGRVGRRLVELTAPFQLTVLACEVAPDHAFLRRHQVRLVALEELLAHADIVSLHLPYTPSVRHLMNRTRFRLMKRGAVFINTARGGLVDHDALVSALRTRRLGGAALDVFETEPYRGVLSRMPNVITTPHVASFTKESWRAMEQHAVDNLLAELSRSQRRVVVKPGKRG